MELKKAIKLFTQYNPKRKAVGYWEQDGKIILNTTAYYDSEGMPEPGQYIVSEDGEIIPTNPIRSDLSEEGYIKF